MSDPCGKDCKGYPRRRFCSDRTCGGGDCSTCYGPGICHDRCDDPCPDCHGSGWVAVDAGSLTVCPAAEGDMDAERCPNCAG